jgi:hypothetical protein
MYGPSDWPSLAKQLVGIHEFLQNATSTPSSTQAKRSPDTRFIDILPRQSTNNTSGNQQAIDYAFQGVTCADALDAGNTTTKDVFDFLVYTTRTVSPMCEFWIAARMNASLTD